MSAASYNNLRDVVFHAAANFPDTRFFITEDEEFPYITGKELKHYCGAFGRWICDLDTHPSHIAVLGHNGAAWLSVFFSTISAGCVVVPLHVDAGEDDLQYYLEKSDADILIYDRACQRVAVSLCKKIENLISFEMHDLLTRLNASTEEYFPPLLSDSPAAFYFTSGTTTRSRCVVLTHRNMASHTNAAMSILPLSPKDSGLSILPVSHTFEIMTNIVGALHCGGTMYINGSLRDVKKNMKKYEPSIIVCVPLVLQTIQKEILRTAKKNGKLKMLQKAMKINFMTQHIGIDLSRFLFREIYDILGHNIRYFLCGGASLDKELILFYKAIGIEVIQGYGITECTPIVAANLPGANNLGSIGKPFPSCEVRIIDGEICVRGDSVSPGYYDDDILTSRHFRSGWFHTGDLGYIDRNGFLHFTGRQSNLIVLANGENVSAEALEEKLGHIEGIEESIVFDHNGMITAEVYVDPDIFPDRDAVWKAVMKLNRTLPSYQQIGEVLLRDHEFEKTVTQKIKRHAV